MPVGQTIVFRRLSRGPCTKLEDDGVEKQGPGAGGGAGGGGGPGLCAARFARRTGDEIAGVTFRSGVCTKLEDDRRQKTIVCPTGEVNFHPNVLREADAGVLEFRHAAVA